MLNTLKNMTIINNDIINKRYEIKNTMNTLNIKNSNNLLNSFDNNTKILKKKILASTNKRNIIFSIKNYNNIKKDCFNSNIYTDIY